MGDNTGAHISTTKTEAKIHETFQYLQRLSSIGATVLEVVHDPAADFHDVPLNAIIGGHDGNGNMIYVGTDPSHNNRSGSVLHDGSELWITINNPVKTTQITNFHVLVLQQGKIIITGSVSHYGSLL